MNHTVCGLCKPEMGL